MVQKARNGTKIITCAPFNHIQLILSMNRYCAHQKKHSALVNVVIVNPPRIDLLPQSYPTQRFVAFDATQAKENNYCNQHPTNQFFLLAIEVFGCLHKQANVLIHNCANAIWNFKGLSSFCLGHFYLSKCFNHIAKDATILHLKSGGNYRLNYFSTSTPS
jgi:hypothetical protein